MPISQIQYDEKLFQIACAIAPAIITRSDGGGYRVPQDVKKVAVKILEEFGIIEP